MPRWVRWLQPLLSGVFTVDNLDYVRRDAYLTGVAVGPVDVERLRRYTFISERGLTLYEPGLAGARDVPDRRAGSCTSRSTSTGPCGRSTSTSARSSGRRSGRSSATARRPTSWPPTPTSTSTRSSTRPPAGRAARRSAAEPIAGDGTVTPAIARCLAGDPAAPADLARRGRDPRRVRGRRPARRRSIASLGAAEPGRVAIDLAEVDARPADAAATDGAPGARGPRRRERDRCSAALGLDPGLLAHRPPLPPPARRALIRARSAASVARRRR